MSTGPVSRVIVEITVSEVSSSEVSSSKGQVG